MNILASISSTCSDYTIAAILNLVHDVINIMQVIAPIVLIISLVVLFSKRVVNPEDQKANKRLINVIMATILCFLLPTILNIVLSTLPGTVQNLDLEACWINAYDVEYDENGGAVGSGQSPTKLGVNFSSLLTAVGRGVTVSTWGTPNVSQCGNIPNPSNIRPDDEPLPEAGSEKAVALARCFIGYPYVYRGTGEELTTDNYNALKQRYGSNFYADSIIERYLDKGYLAYDGASFVSEVYKLSGHTGTSSSGAAGTDQIIIPNNFQDLCSQGVLFQDVPGGQSNAEPGDLLYNCIQNQNGEYSGHAAIYVGNNRIVHNVGAQKGVVEEDLTGTYQYVKRMFPLEYPVEEEVATENMCEGVTKAQNSQLIPVNASFEEKLIARAKCYLGYPYVYKGTGQDLTARAYENLKAWYGADQYDDRLITPFLDKGYIATDNESFVTTVFKDVNQALSTSAKDLCNNPGVGNNKVLGNIQKKVEPGDIVLRCTGGDKEGEYTGGHAAIYIGSGKVIHNASPSQGVRIETLSTRYNVRWRMS